MNIIRNINVKQVGNFFFNELGINGVRIIDEIVHNHYIYVDFEGY